jgi:hypothetical protein
MEESGEFMIEHWALGIGSLVFGMLALMEALALVRRKGTPPARGAAVTFEPKTDEEVRALRLAKTMISDLYAYHWKDIKKGRAGRCLYLLIGKVLDKALETYAERVGAECRARTRYLETLLVEDIAQGRIEAFGNPGFVRRIKGH